MKVKVIKKSTYTKKNKIDICIDQHTLAKAIFEANCLLREDRDKKSADALRHKEEKRKEILGLKDYSHIKNKQYKRIRESLNQLHCNWKVLNLSKNEAQYFTTISALTKILTNALLSLIQIVLYAICVVFFIVAFFAKTLFFHCILVSVLFFVLGRFVRIAKFEVENIEDNGYLLNIAMMVTAVVTLFAPFVWYLVCKFISCVNIGGI